jgi:hypothetical protein
MTTYCKIGPIQLPNQYITDNDNPGVGDGAEGFSIICLPSEAYQIRGLVTPFIKEQFYNRNVLNIPDGYWGLLPIDASTGLDDNDYLNHRGLGYLITSAAISSINPQLVLVDLTVEEILAVLSDYLKMDYTSGLGDGTQLTTNYSMTVKNDRINDQFTSLDTVNMWYPAVSDSTLTGAGFSIVSGELQATGSASHNTSLGTTFITNRNIVTAPFTIETTLEWTSGIATVNPYYFSLNLTKSKPATTADINTNLDLFRIIVKVTTSASFLIQSRIKGKWVTFYTGSLTSGQLTPNFKIVISNANKMTIYVDKAGTTNWVQCISNIDVSTIDFSKGYYLTYAYNNASSTTKLCSSQQIEVYNYDAFSPINVVSLPANVSGSLNSQSSFTRPSADGNILCYPNPTGTLLYQPTIDTFYLGTVKGFTNDYADSVYRLITNSQITLNPLNFYVTNGIIQLTTTSNGIQVSYWNGSIWVLLDTFIIGTITRLKVTKSTPTKFSFKANQTEWTLEIGKPYCRVKHPQTTLTHTLRNTAFDDNGIVTGIVSGASIPMQTQNYSVLYNTADTFRLLILKQNMSTILSDSIPPDTMTGIGIVDSTQIAGSYKDAIGISREFWFQTLQSIMTE